MRHFGKYRLVRTLGEGAYGRVYEAVMQGPMGFEKRVALKVMRDAGEGGLQKSLAREARVGALLQHPNVAAILEFGSVKGRHYLAMEYVDGATLAEVIQAARMFGKLPPPAAVIEVGRQACKGLAHVHEATDLSGLTLGLVHRDIKPSNLMVSRLGLVKILDFGIARAEAVQGPVTATGTGIIRGTLHYLSPEQVDARSAISGRSDLFSLGVVMYELLTGEPLFGGPSVPNVLHRITSDVPESCFQRAHAASAELVPVLRRLLARDPERRFTCASEAESAFAELVRRQPLEGGLATALDPWMPVCHATLKTEPTEVHRPRRTAWLLAVLALCVGVGGLVSSWDRRGEEPSDKAQTVGPPPVPNVIDAIPQPQPASTAPATPTPKTRDHRPPTAVLEPSPVMPPTTGIEPTAENPPTAVRILAPGSVTLGFRPFAEVFIDGVSIGDQNRLARHALAGGHHMIEMVCWTCNPIHRKTIPVEIDGSDVRLGCWDLQVEAPCEVPHVP